MTKMEKIGELQTKEIKAREGYIETGDRTFLETMLDCLRERQQLLYKRLPVRKVEIQVSKS